jgi:hypothetical protein
MANKNDSIAVWRAKVKQSATWNSSESRFDLGAAAENSLDIATAYVTDNSVVPYWIETTTGEWEFGVGVYAEFSSSLNSLQAIESSDGVNVALTLADTTPVTISVPPFATQNFNGFSGSIYAETFAAGTNNVDFGAVSATIDTDYYSKWDDTYKNIAIPTWAYAFRVHLSGVSFGNDTTGTYRGLILGGYMDNPQWVAADGDKTRLCWVSPWIIRDGGIDESVALQVTHDATASIDVSCDFFLEFLLGISDRVGV